MSVLLQVILILVMDGKKIRLLRNMLMFGRLEKNILVNGLLRNKEIRDILCLLISDFQLGALITLYTVPKARKSKVKMKYRL